jgi:hypothetical protein
VCVCWCVPVFLCEATLASALFLPSPSAPITYPCKLAHQPLAHDCSLLECRVFVRGCELPTCSICTTRRRRSYIVISRRRMCYSHARSKSNSPILARVRRSIVVRARVALRLVGRSAVSRYSSSLSARVRSCDNHSGTSFETECHVDAPRLCDSEGYT